MTPTCVGSYTHAHVLVHKVQSNSIVAFLQKSMLNVVFIMAQNM